MGDKNERGSVDLDAFTRYLIAKHSSQLVPESVENFKISLRKVFDAMMKMTSPREEASLDGHGFRYGALLAGEFYFDAAKDAALGCGCSEPVADVLQIVR